MPIDLKRYPSSWPKVSRTIRRIAGWRCEWCKIEHGAPLPSGRPGKVVLTVAHLGTPYADGRPGDKHDKHDIRRENLAALCQACHLRYDLEDHIQHARETRWRKKREQAQVAGQLLLFPEQEAARAFHNEPARSGNVPQPIEPGQSDMCSSHICRCVQMSKMTSACLKPPVEGFADFADVFSTDPAKTYQGQEEKSRYNAISEQVGILPLPSRTRGILGHCSAMFFSDINVE